MHRMTVRIAVYGKGGIGKSTISSNLSRTLSSMGLRVLHIGCDPKHDSCRPLLHRNVPCTASEYIRDNLPSGRNLNDVLCEDSRGVSCIEAGGPEPGIGCAGKGILTMFSALERMGINYNDYDVVIYDVLGDVVCGGFAVPMRERYSDMMLIVTSGEFMSLYAANNILRGMMNFETTRPRPVSLILNRRGMPAEDSLASAFSEATNVPIIASFDKSTAFQEAEKAGTTVCDMFPESPEAKAFGQMAMNVLSFERKSSNRPEPLTDDQMDVLFSSGRLDGRGSYRPSRRAAAPDPTIPVHQPRRRTGKGAVSAMREAGKVEDIGVIVHGTPSCGFSMLCEISDRRAAAGGSFRPMSDIICTCLGASDVVNGSNGRLRDSLEKLACEGMRCIVVVVTCLPHMIGDDLAHVLDWFRGEHPGIHVILAEGGGTDVGNDAHMEVLLGLADLVDTDVDPKPNEITIVDDTFLGIDSGRNLEHIGNLVSDIGLRLRPGFLQFCCIDDIIRLREAGIATLGCRSRDTLKLRDALSDKGLVFMDRPLPKGVHETIPWITELGEITGRQDVAERTVANIGERYSGALADTGAALRGKRVAIVTESPQDDSWIFRTLDDTGADVTLHVVGGAQGSLDIPEIRHENRPELLSWLTDESQDIVLSRVDLTYGYTGLRLDPPSDTMTHEASIGLLRWLSNVSKADRQRTWTTWRTAYVG